MKVTQKEIAERLGVSVATVSRALNDQPGVSDEVRAKVLAVVREARYVPHVPARSLATAATQTAAFVVHKGAHSANEDPFYPVIMAGAEAYLSRHGYHILLATLDDHAMARPEEFSLVGQGRVDGLILAGPDISPAFILGMRTAGVPLVLVDNDLSQTTTNCVRSDDRGGGYTATRHLLDHQHSRVVFLSGPDEWTSNRERAYGYRRAMEENDLEPLIIHERETTITSGERACARALNKWPDLTGVCAANDAMAIGAIRAAARMGRQTPTDLSVIGFDDISWAELNDPPLTTIHVFKQRIGELAAQRLLDAIEHPDTIPAKTLVATELVVRVSCGHAE